jgi:EAL domain-containing protein (putative c-di-GMP-specific phosphodiesterase class I)
LRWRHRDKGLLPPSEFIGIAEKVGVHHPARRMVLRKACDDAADWSAYTRLAVNISPRNARRLSRRPS